MMRVDAARLVLVWFVSAGHERARYGAACLGTAWEHSFMQSRLGLACCGPTGFGTAWEQQLWQVEACSVTARNGMVSRGLVGRIYRQGMVGSGTLRCGLASQGEVRSGRFRHGVGRLIHTVEVRRGRAGRGLVGSGGSR
jgi:hypothetical protein